MYSPPLHSRAKDEVHNASVGHSFHRLVVDIFDPDEKRVSISFLRSVMISAVQ